jgi:hypothetical protein
MGRRDRFARCDSRDLDHRSVIHNGDNTTGQVRRHSLGGPACSGAPTSTTGGASGSSARSNYAAEAHVHAAKTNCSSLDSQDGLSG